MIFTLSFLFLSSSSHQSSLLLPAAPGPGGGAGPVRDSALCDCGLQRNGPVDQRWPGIGWRERPTRYGHYPCFCCPLLPPALCIYCPLCLIGSCCDQCPVSLEISSLSVSRWGFYTNEWRGENAPLTDRLLLHTPNFNLLLSILRVW